VSFAGRVGAAPTRLDPNNDQARSWLLHELAKPPYRDTRDPLTRALQALEDWLVNLLSGRHLQVHPLPTIVAVLVAVLLVVLLAYLMRFVRRTARGPQTTSPTVLGDERLSADQYRGRARRAFDEQRYAECVLDVLRAIAQGAVERTLLDDAPSLTAHEIGTRLSAVFPTASAELHWAADRFDAVAYGSQAPPRTDAARLLELDRLLTDLRPARLGQSSTPQVDARSDVPAEVGR
jgi:hypothetical protein